VEFVTDPAIPPIPPHADLDQMENTAAALLRGDPDAWRVVSTGIRSKAQEFLPGPGCSRSLPFA
jgi:pyruvate dehydrogenase (quinone)